jgi:tetratricopeptide (TPR) repeat protein
LMYWPSVPVLLLAAVGIVHFWQRYCAPGRRLEQSARLLRGLGVLVVAALGLRSVVRNVDWHDTFTLCARDVRTYPQGAHLNKGYALDLMRAASDVKDPRLQREMLETAEQHLIAALQINPAYGSALAMRARIRAHLGDTRGAQRDAESALLLEPLNHDALFVLSHLPGASETAELRVAELRAATTTRPADAALQVALGTALLDLEQPAAARQHFERALTLEPDNVAALQHLGQTLAALGRNDEAIAVFRQALALAPDHWSTHANLSLLLAHRDVAAALRHAERARELEPRELRANLNLAEVYLIAGQQDQALQILRNVERLLEAGSPFKPIVQARIKRLEGR